MNEKSILNYHIFLLGLLTAILFSSFIYLEHFGFTIKSLNTLTAILALWLLLHIPSKSILVAGTIIGVLWFYWIGNSFVYNGVGYISPFITLFFAFFGMFFFGLVALSSKVYIRAIVLFAITFLEPFDWNWLQLELIFVDSYIGLTKLDFIIVLVSLSAPTYLKKLHKKLTLAPLFLIVLALHVAPYEYKEHNLKIKIISMNIHQEKKWLRESLAPTISEIFMKIDKAKNSGYDLVIFPESVFPFFMNRHQTIIERLKIESKDISIVVGSLLREGDSSYNVTYIFTNGDYKVAKKLVLVPFGEYVPLPKFARDFINDTFFSSQADFLTATKPTDFIVKGVKFRNAICYEATCSEIYEGEVDFVVATSNNAWFTPSIEPTLQKLLLRFYARKNGALIYHSANRAGTGIVK